MTMNNFKLELIDNVQTALGNKGNVFFEKKLVKDVSMEFLTIKLTSDGRCCSLPLASLYKLRSSGMSVFEIANAVTTSLTFKENIDKNTIAFRLINAVENEELLKTVPHIPFYDMAIIFQCVTFSEKSRYFLTISQSLMESNNLTLQQMADLAMKNTFRLFPCLARLLTLYILEELMANKNTTLEDFQAFAVHAFNSKRNPIFQTTCKDYPNGSVAMLNFSFLSQIAEDLGHDLLLLPSSEQNFAIIPYTKEISKQSVHQMVTEALATDNEPILTRYTFLFHRATKQLEIFV